MTFVDKLYCGKLPGAAGSNAEANDRKVYEGCLYAAEQVPVKAGLFALGAFVLGAALMHFSMKSGGH